MRQDVAGGAGRAARAAWRGLAVVAVLAAAGCRAAPRQEPRTPAERRPEAARSEAAASERRKVYLTAGHGELMDPAPQPPTAIERRTTELRRVLGGLVAEVAELAPRELAAGVPGDAALVMVLGPSKPLPPAEWAALERYLDRGGRLMIVLDPAGATSMGPLEGRLGLRMLPGHLVDDKEFLPQRGTPSDRRFAITTQLSAHASTISLVRSNGKGLIVIDAGALEEIPFTSRRPAPQRTITIRSMASAWLDLDQPQNFELDAATERRGRWNLGAAVEGPKPAGKDGFRALVFSDAELFVDVLVAGPNGRAQAIMVSGPLLADSIRWLAGDAAIRRAAGAKKTERGTFYRVLKAGKGGPRPGPTDTVVVHYTGWTTDGHLFDSSIVRGAPAELPLDGLIPGWTDGLQRVSAGDRVRLWIPEALAYKGAPGRPQGMLVFDVELLEIKPKP